MTTAVTGLDTVASLVIMIIVAASLLTLLGMGAMMAIGAVSSNRPLVTSWPADQEPKFAVFEKHGSSSNSLSWLFGFLGGGLFLLFVVGVYFAIPPEKKDMTKGMNMSNLSKKTKPKAETDAAKPDAPAPAEAPKAAAPSTDTPAAAPAEAPKQ